MKKQTNLLGVKSLLTVLGVTSIAPQLAEAKKNEQNLVRPNVILINIDDLGWGDPSCYGGDLIRTVNMDRLAKEGIQCTNGYVSAPVSGVSRVGLLTGSYQQRYGMQWNHDQWKTPKGGNKKMLPDEQTQLQTAFKHAGYVTAMSGKIGFDCHQPFDNYYSFSMNGVNSFPDEHGRYANVDVKSKGDGPKINKNILWGGERDGEEHLTDRCGRQCVEFIKANKDKPFFYYLAFNAPHTPLHAKASDKHRVAHIKSPVAQVFYSMVLTVDDNIGRILDCLEELKLRDNTIVILLSDNGPANPQYLSKTQDWWIKGVPYHVLGRRGGLNGCKGTMWEAGIRVPYIISWTGGLPKGMTYTKPVSTLDIYPTLCSAARLAASHTTILDGVDLMPYLSGGYENTEPHDALYWYANRMGAVRQGDWKMLIEDDFHYLFNLKEDPSEKKNVMKEHPEIMEQLLDKYFQFRNTMPAYRNPYVRPIDHTSEEVKALIAVDAE